MGFNINQQPYFGDRKFYFAYRLPVTDNAGTIRRSTSGIIKLRGGNYRWADDSKVDEPSYQDVINIAKQYGTLEQAGLDGKKNTSRYGSGFYTREFVMVLPDSTAEEISILENFRRMGNEFIKSYIEDDERYQTEANLTFKEVPMDATETTLDGMA